MNLIQIILVIFFLYASGRVVKRYQTNELPFGITAAWIIFWLVACVVVLVPNSTASVAKLVGIGRGADVVVYVSVAALFFLFFRLMVRVEKLNRDITRVTRELALQQENKKTRNQKINEPGKL